MTLRYQIYISVEQLQVCSITAASLPFLLSFCYHSCISWWDYSHAALVTQPTKAPPVSFLKNMLSDWLVELNHSLQHGATNTSVSTPEGTSVCHKLARNDGYSNIFTGYCCQTWKLAHNSRLSRIAFPYFMTIHLCHSSFSNTTTPYRNLPPLAEVELSFTGPTVKSSDHLFTLQSPAFFPLMFYPHFKF